MTKEELKNLPYVKSLKHKQMSIEERSAQFMPFAALVGHDAQIAETARITESIIILDEYEKMDLNEKVTTVLKLNHPFVEITYFVKDPNKEGGKYETITNYIKKYDDYNKVLVMEDGLKIDITDIVSIDHEIFRNLI